MEKKCEVCGNAFKKRRKDSDRQWSERAFCSIPCANKIKKTVPPHLSFWRHANPVAGDGCWNWTGVADKAGYGRIAFMLSKAKAHRVSYEMRYGPIPDGLVIRHKCDNPRCVNPEHLVMGTQKDNMQDASTRGRLNPKSLENLRPGAAGVYGAGPKSNKELKNGR